MTQLIVALDFDSAIEARGLTNTLVRDAGVRWFKVGPRTLLSSGATELCERIVDYANLFLDLKLYDTRDTVAATARRAWEIGVRLLTVHGTPSMLEAATEVRIFGQQQKVLAVSGLTDGSGGPTYSGYRGELFDGIICSVPFARTIRMATDKLLVCPGIRIFGSPHDNHYERIVATPVEARAAGVDFIVVGRPIYAAPDPAAVARAILEEL